jgi:hypothetical protein
MDTVFDRAGVPGAGIRELARRSAGGIDVALMWDADADEAFVLVYDEGEDEHFRIAMANQHALDAFHHPYAHRYRIGRQCAAR